MESNFTSEFFRANRQRLRALSKSSALIVLTANGLLQRNDDNTFHFRQDSNFWYLTGINIADAILVMDGGSEYIIMPDQQDYQWIFEGVILDEQLAADSGIVTILDEKAGWKRLGAQLKKAKKFATLEAPEPYIDFYRFYTNPAKRALIAKIKSINPAIETQDLRQYLTKMRMIKQLPELKAIKKAIAITTEALEAVRLRLSNYKFEYEIEADLTRGFRQRGSTGNAFHPIVAGGKNACVLHYSANSGALDKARFVLFDVGAEVDNYAADLAGTYWRVAKNEREYKVYNAVLEVQAYAYSLLKPGVLIKEYEKQIEQFMGEKLRELGLIKTIEHQTVRKYFPHATSHHLGLDAHDIADYERPLEPGMVLAVEPGIYIPDETIGIRIENNVRITKNGLTVLSAKLKQ